MNEIGELVDHGLGNPGDPALRPLGPESTIHDLLRSGQAAALSKCLKHGKQLIKKADGAV